MPELPEVETTKTSLTPLLNQSVIGVEIYQPKLRWQMPDDLSSLQGYKLQQVSRRAKYLILTFQKMLPDKSTKQISSNTPSALQKKLIIHLGMSGSLQQHPSGAEKRKHDHLIITFETRNELNDLISTQLHYHDPRRFGAVLWYEDYVPKLFNHLGVEPLTEDFNVDYLYRRIWRIEESAKAVAKLDKNKEVKSNKPSVPITRPIKSIIMDQSYVVGVGNIYATESLFLAGIHPLTPANTLNKDQLALLIEHIKSILKTAIAKGGSTLKDFTVASGKTGYFQQTLNVYGKYNELCPVCGTDIDKVSITGRASTFCPKCQPLKPKV